MTTGVPRLCALPRGDAGKHSHCLHCWTSHFLSIDIMSQTSVPEIGIWQLLYNHGAKPFPENHGMSDTIFQVCIY